MSDRRWPILKRITAMVLIPAMVLVLGAVTHAQGAQSHSPAIKTGGTVVINWGPKGSWTQNFNPFSNSPTDGTLELLYEPLLMFNQMKGGKAVPWLAKSYKWSNQNKTLTFELRPGVKWNDGKPFTSADVKFSISLAKTNPGINCGDCWTYLSSISTPKGWPARSDRATSAATRCSANRRLYSPVSGSIIACVRSA